MRKIVVANQKGGCAKTTTVVNLAACLAELGQKVLVIDLDPQSNSSQWLGAPRGGRGSLRLLSTSDTFADLVAPSNTEGVNVIAASQELAEIEKLLAGKLAVEGILKRRLENSELNQWDFILIDTPPTLGLITLNALTAAEELLVPVTTHVMTLIGVTQLMNTVDNVKNVLNPDLKTLGFVASRFDGRTRHSRDVLASLTDAFGSMVFSTVINENIRLAEAPSYEESIVRYDRKSQAYEDYRSLALEVLNKKAT